MADLLLGRRLIDAGWDQGVLLPALSWSVVFHREDPITALARKSLKDPVAAHAAAMAPHVLGSGTMSVTDRLVVASQACDIVKSLDVEPTVMAMRVFETTKERILKAAARNSSYHFLLDPDRGLVVDARVLTLIEKPLLATLTPAPGAPDADMRRRFARWLARRYNRPALDDTIVKAVVAPILEHLRALQEAGDAVIDVLDELQEVRLVPPVGPLPYAVRLLFVLPDRGGARREVIIAELAALVGQMRDWFDPASARLDGWDAAELYEITAGDYMDTDELLLEEYTYQGRTVRGLQPRQFRE